MKRCVAILETMWDWRSMTSNAGYKRAPRYFHINPDNHTGKRLYYFLDDKYSLLVTNVCRELVSGPNEHGKPNKVWLRNNLKRLMPIDLLLVCGNPAKETFAKVRSKHKFIENIPTIILMPHPAARIWSRDKLSLVKNTIKAKTYSRIAFEIKNRELMLYHGEV